MHHVIDSLRRSEPDQVQRDSLSRASEVTLAPRSVAKCNWVVGGLWLCTGHRPPATGSKQSVSGLLNDVAITLRRTEMRHFQFTMFIAGHSPRSQRAIANLRRIAQERLGGDYELAIVDVQQEP